jgi:hypothetical protein
VARRKVEQERHRRDQVFAVEGAENDPFAAVGGSQRVAPECFCRLNGKGMHEAHRASMGDGFDQHVAERRANIRR